MKYFKVKPEADQVRTRIIYKHQILVANEVYTSREIERAKQAKFINDEFISKHFESFEVRKKETYIFFGARFFARTAELLPAQP